MKSEDGTGGRRRIAKAWLGDVDCHPPISFDYLDLVEIRGLLRYKKKTA